MSSLGLLAPDQQWLLLKGQGRNENDHQRLSAGGPKGPGAAPPSAAPDIGFGAVGTVAGFGLGVPVLGAVGSAFDTAQDYSEFQDQYPNFDTDKLSHLSAFGNNLSFGLLGSSYVDQRREALEKEVQAKLAAEKVRQRDLRIMAAEEQRRRFATRKQPRSGGGQREGRSTDAYASGGRADGGSYGSAGRGGFGGF